MHEKKETEKKQEQVVKAYELTFATAGSNQSITINRSTVKDSSVPKPAFSASEIVERLDRCAFKSGGDVCDSVRADCAGNRRACARQCADLRCGEGYGDVSGRQS